MDNYLNGIQIMITNILKTQLDTDIYVSNNEPPTGIKTKP